MEAGQQQARRGPHVCGQPPRCPASCFSTMLLLDEGWHLQPLWQNGHTAPWSTATADAMGSYVLVFQFLLDSLRRNSYDRAGREAQRRFSARYCRRSKKTRRSYIGSNTYILLYHAPLTGGNTQHPSLKPPVARKQVNNNTSGGTCNGLFGSVAAGALAWPALCGDDTIVKKTRQTTELQSRIRPLIAWLYGHNHVVIADPKR